MGVLTDWMIRKLAVEESMIEPFAEGVKRPNTISYGLTSMGYDIRLGYRFKVMKDYPCSVIDPKAFDQRMLEDVDLTPEDCRWNAVFGPIRDVMHFNCVRCKNTETIRAGGGMPVKRLCPAVSDHILIPPNSFALGESVETFNIPRDVMVVVLGKSTLARCGLILNVTPGEPEWVGKWTLELSNTTRLPMKVYCGEGIGQCVFLRTDGVSEALLNAVRRLCGSPMRGNTIPSLIDHALKLIEDHLHKDLGRSTCEVSYKDKSGKYSDQKGLTTPKVD